MPGFRVSEKIEVRPGEARMEEIKEIDQKVSPFTHELPGTGGIASPMFDPASNPALREFMEIGERGGLPEGKLEAMVRNYDVTRIGPLVIRKVEIGENGLPTAEIRNSSWGKSLVGYLKKVGSLFGGGFGGPMMIFGGLLFRPEGKPTFEAQVTEELGSKLHNQWREEKKWREGKLRPEYRSTADEAWIRAHDGEKRVDIANTEFSDLPVDVKQENHQFISAKIVMEEIQKAENNQTPFDLRFIDSAAEALFKGLLPYARKTYGELPNFIKEGFRQKIKTGIQLYLNRKLEILNNFLRAWDEGKTEGDDHVYELSDERSRLAQKNLNFMGLMKEEKPSNTAN